MRLRPCTAADIPAVAAIYATEVERGTATFELVPPSVGEMSGRHRALLDDGFPYLVAEIDREIAGYAYAGAYRMRPAYRSTVENSVYLHPRFRRRGVGSALLAALVDDASARGFRQMIAVIGDCANVASLKLHERAGFTHAGVLRSVGWKHGRWLDTVLMQRALGPGDGAASGLAPPA